MDADLANNFNFGPLAYNYVIAIVLSIRETVLADQNSSEQIFEGLNVDLAKIFNFGPWARMYHLNGLIISKFLVRADFLILKKPQLRNFSLKGQNLHFWLNRRCGPSFVCPTVFL